MFTTRVSCPAALVSGQTPLSRSMAALTRPVTPIPRLSGFVVGTLSAGVHVFKRRVVELWQCFASTFLSQMQRCGRVAFSSAYILYDTFVPYLFQGLRILHAACTGVV